MDVKTQLLIERVATDLNSIHMTSHLDSSLENILIGSTEYLPLHFHSAVGRNLHGRRDCFLCERQAERPSTEDIPILDTRMSFQGDELTFALLGDSQIRN